MVAADRELIDTLKGMLCFDRESRQTVMKNKLWIACRDSRWKP